LNLHRRYLLALPLALVARPLWAADRHEVERDMVTTWYRLVLELVRHTATYSPPVASRAFAYIGVAAHEALASGNPALVSLAGQVNGLTPAPAREAAEYDEACVLQAVMAASAQNFFSNTGPTGQRAMVKLSESLGKKAMEGIAEDVVARSIAYGQAVAGHVLAWSLDDGGAVVENMGFPQEFTPGTNPRDWVPTSLVRQQQAPLLPSWGQNRTFAMPAGNSCALPEPPTYSEEPGSDFHNAALEVYETVKTLTDEQKLIARFWSDDPMLSPTPPGHWISIAINLGDEAGMPATEIAPMMATLGIAMADAFIGCWDAKFQYNTLRPITYIRRHIDPKWEPLLITPPFPEYPSGHSTVSAAAATVLTRVFGTDFAFDDATHEDEGLPVRSFSSFDEAAEEAAMSRLYGGIHFRFGNEAGTTQGRCIGAHAAALKTRV
jgi:hypothetical protein